MFIVAIEIILGEHTLILLRMTHDPHAQLLTALRYFAFAESVKAIGHHPVKDRSACRKRLASELARFCVGGDFYEHYPADSMKALLPYLATGIDLPTIKKSSRTVSVDFSRSNESVRKTGERE